MIIQYLFKIGRFYLTTDRLFLKTIPRFPNNTLYAKLSRLKIPGYIGFAPEMYQLMTVESVKSEDSDQLYYTKLYLDDTIRVINTLTYIVYKQAH